MKLKNVNFGKIGGALKVAGHHLREVRPEIMLGVGAIGVLVGTIMACKKTKEAEPIIDNAKERKEELDYIRNNAQAEEKPGFKEYVRVYARAGYELVKVYWRSALVWVGGIVCIFGSHGEMRSRNAKLITETVGLSRLIATYRAAVREKLGEEVEKELFFGVEEADIEYEETDPATGEVKKTKTKGKVFKNSQSGSMYARNFTPRTSDEFDVRSYADFFLDARIVELNKKLKMVPFITLNEVYDALGFKPGEGKCADGMTVGWVWNPKIDRGDREIRVERLEGWEEVYDPITGRTKFEPCLRLDFNCYPLEGLI